MSQPPDPNRMTELTIILIFPNSLPVITPGEAFQGQGTCRRRKMEHGCPAVPAKTGFPVSIPVIVRSPHTLRQEGSIINAPGADGISF